MLWLCEPLTFSEVLTPRSSAGGSRSGTRHAPGAALLERVGRDDQAGVAELPFGGVTPALAYPAFERS
jgi:hypothetical protein